jgi:hypothetical protein
MECLIGQSERVVRNDGVLVTTQRLVPERHNVHTLRHENLTLDQINYQ